jgi:ABC-type glutathione transport system ATPase component
LDPDYNIAPDLDVVEETRRITSTQMKDLMVTDKLIIRNLSKSYGIIRHFNVVRGISVGISEQECFGLLGQNGAGKTTTFKMLTGDEMISDGNAYINGFSVQSQLRQVNILEIFQTYGINKCAENDGKLLLGWGEVISFLIKYIKLYLFDAYLSC